MISDRSLPPLPNAAAFTGAPGRENVASPDRLASMRRVRSSDVGDCGDDFSGYADSFEVVVSRHVVGDDSEERGQRSGPSACVGSEAVPDRLDLAAQIAERHGQAGAGSPDRPSGG